MSRSRSAVITVACMLPLFLALGIMGTVTYREYWTDADGNLVFYGDTHTYTTDTDGDFTFGVICNDAFASYCGGTICAACHTGGEDTQKESYTVDKHRQGYFPRFALSLSEGQKLSWGQRGGYLTSRRGQLEYYLKDGTLNAITPPGSLILKDRSSRPFILHMPGVPTLKPPSR
jgi:hypothetical protein